MSTVWPVLAEILFLGPVFALVACMVWHDPDLRFERRVAQEDEENWAAIYRAALDPPSRKKGT